MGMYTELILGAKLKPATPPEVITTLQFMVTNEHGATLPDSWPFSKDNNRFRWLFTTGSYSFAVTHAMTPTFEFDSIGNQWTIATRSNLKNYEGEIETFLAWLKPWIEQGSGARDFYAIVTYEEAEEPTIYYLYKKGAS
jgi:hypothetical protein